MKKHVRWGQRVAGRGSQGGLLWGGDTWAETWIKRGSKSFLSLVGGASTLRALAIHVSISPATSALSGVFIHQPPLGTYSRAGLALKLPPRPVPPASSPLPKRLSKRLLGTCLGPAEEHGMISQWCMSAGAFGGRSSLTANWLSSHCICTSRTQETTSPCCLPHCGPLTEWEILYNAHWGLAHLSLQRRLETPRGQGPCLVSESPVICMPSSRSDI